MDDLDEVLTTDKFKSIFNAAVLTSGSTLTEEELNAVLTDEKLKERLQSEVVDTYLKSIEGIQGIQGPAGPQGDQGSRGSPGVAGPQGSQGPTGSAGSQGPQGPKGDRGIQGSKGDKGDTGPSGSDGVDGTLGNVFKPAGILVCYYYPKDTSPTADSLYWNKNKTSTLTQMVEWCIDDSSDGSSQDQGTGSSTPPN